ncbi:N-acetyltransferase [Halobacteriales archaeon QS_8_69_26]|nr:MAG: N-acetyltransferase [Halobacteriales archaeon QS_8_69_26]
MADASVRPADPDEATGVERVARESWHAAYDDILGADTVDSVLDEWYDVDGLRESIDRDDHVFLVADDGGVAGFAHAGRPPDDDYWHLTRIYVLPDRWGDGVGTALLERLESELDEREVESYRLAVLADNEVGVSFYESRGFERFDEGTVELGGVETTEYWYRKEV